MKKKKKKLGEKKRKERSRQRDQLKRIPLRSIEMKIRFKVPFVTAARQLRKVRKKFSSYFMSGSILFDLPSKKPLSRAGVNR